MNAWVEETHETADMCWAPSSGAVGGPQTAHPWEDSSGTRGSGTNVGRSERVSVWLQFLGSRFRTIHCTDTRTPVSLLQGLVI